MYEYVVPGDGEAGYCLAGGRHLLAVDGGLQARIPRLWSLLTTPGTRLEDLFAALAGDAVSTMPAFVVAEVVDAGVVRALVHGEAIARPHGATGAQLSGAGLATWRESSWRDVEGIMIGLGPMRTGVETLPLAAGVVRADWIRWRADAAAVAPEEPTAATTTVHDRAAAAAPPTGDAGAAPAPTGPAPAIRLDAGPPLDLGLPVVLGRRPEAGLTDAGAPTVPVTVASPRRLISARHLLIERDGGGVRLQDLRSKNGSLVRSPDGATRVLRDGEHVTVPIGTLVELGEGAVLEVVAQPER